MFGRPMKTMKSGNKKMSDRCEKIILLFEQLDEMFVTFCCGDDDGNAMYDCVH